MTADELKIEVDKLREWAKPVIEGHAPYVKPSGKLQPLPGLAFIQQMIDAQQRR